MQIFVQDPKASAAAGFELSSPKVTATYDATTSLFFNSKIPPATNPVKNTPALPKNPPILSNASTLLLAFIPIVISAYGHNSPYPPLLASIPKILPISASAIGTAKLRITIDSTSCSAAIPIPPILPLSIQRKICAGGIPVSPTIFPVTAKSTHIHPCKVTVHNSARHNFAKNTSRIGTGIVIN